MSRSLKSLAKVHPKSRPPTTPGEIINDWRYLGEAPKRPNDLRRVWVECILCGQVYSRVARNVRTARRGGCRCRSTREAAPLPETHRGWTVVCEWRRGVGYGRLFQARMVTLECPRCWYRIDRYYAYLRRREREGGRAPRCPSCAQSTTKSVTISVNDDMERAINDAAARSGMTRAAFIRWAVMERVDEVRDG